ncbi:MAG: hypothetical protein KJ624_07755 [Chloroflexi bacterium]|nr:hypothetical protein [Chloroflexota bacterium]
MSNKKLGTALFAAAGVCIAAVFLFALVHAPEAVFPPIVILAAVLFSAGLIASR